MSNATHNGDGRKEGDENGGDEGDTPPKEGFTNPFSSSVFLGLATVEAISVLHGISDEDRQAEDDAGNEAVDGPDAEEDPQAGDVDE